MLNVDGTLSNNSRKHGLKNYKSRIACKSYYIKITITVQIDCLKSTVYSDTYLYYSLSNKQTSSRKKKTKKKQFTRHTNMIGHRTDVGAILMSTTTTVVLARRLRTNVSTSALYRKTNGVHFDSPK